MIAFLPHQGGFEKKMSPDNHLDSLDREHREHRTNTNVVKTDAYIKHFSNIFREGMLKRGEVDKLGVVTFEFDEDKWCIVYRILGPIYWPGNPQWLPRVHPRYHNELWNGMQEVGSDDQAVAGGVGMDEAVETVVVKRCVLTGKVIDDVTEHPVIRESYQNESEEEDDEDEDSSPEKKRASKTKTKPSPKAASSQQKMLSRQERTPSSGD
jgi:hypothetical protein